MDNRMLIKRLAVMAEVAMIWFLIDIRLAAATIIACWLIEDYWEK